MGPAASTGHEVFPPAGHVFSTAHGVVPTCGRHALNWARRGPRSLGSGKPSLDPGKDSGQEEKGTTDDEMVGWHHPLDRDEFEQAPGVGDGQEAWQLLQFMGLQKSEMGLQP